MTLLLLTKQVGIESSMHKQQVCSVLGSIEALTREKERDPKVWFEKCDNFNWFYHRLIHVLIIFFLIPNFESYIL